MKKSKAEHRHYDNIHQWLKCNYGKASCCENKKCTYKTPKRFEWALVKGKSYEKNIQNYIQLCPSCHRKYDFTEEIRLNNKRAALNNKIKNKDKVYENHKKVDRFDLNGNFISTHSSLNKAVIETGINKSTILRYLKGTIKNPKYYTWKLSLTNQILAKL